MKWIEHWLRDRRQRVCVNGQLSSWKNVGSGVPQGSVFGPVLFLIFINDIDADIQSQILKFADDTKIFRTVETPDDCSVVQSDLNLLMQWAEKWQMRFNVGKCQVMHLGKKNSQIQSEYYMYQQKLKVCEVERDLGVLMSDDMKVSSQCQHAYLKANRVLGLIRRNIVNKTPDILVRLYKSLVRPHLEYCVSSWSPHYVKDKALLEKIQHRFTRILPTLRKLTYEERLQRLGLWSLEERRNRADLIEVFKMFRGISAVPVSTFFELVTDKRTRGHSFKLHKRHCCTELRRHFFSYRLVDRWNGLSEDTVSASSVNQFKARLEMERREKMGLFFD